MGEVGNVTVVVGREAVLSCSVTSSRGYKVGWMKVRHLLSSTRPISVIGRLHLILNTNCYIMLFRPPGERNIEISRG